MFQKNPRFLFAQNLKTMPVSSSNKKTRNEKKIQILKAAIAGNFVLILSNEIFVIFQNLHAKYCNGS